MWMCLLRYCLKHTNYIVFKLNFVPLKALVKFKIVQVEKTIGANHKNADMLVLTTQTCEPDTVRVFRLLYDLNVAANEVFDPLGMFHDAEEMD